MMGRSEHCLTLLTALMLHGVAAAAEPATPQRLMWYRDEGGAVQPVQTATHWQLRRAAVLRAMQEVMGPLPDRSNLPPLNLRVVASFDGDGYVRQTIRIDSGDGDEVPAYLYLPRPAPTQPRPGVVALHPTGASGKDLIDLPGKANRTYAAELAQRGYVVVSPDYPSFGELKHYDFAADKYASGTMKAIANHMRCVDLLESLPQVDPQRIGVIGHSLGGHNALFLAAFDERIKVTVTSCGWTPFHQYYGGKKLVNWAQDRYMPRVRDVYGSDPDRIPFDFQEVIAAIAPRAVFSNSPLRDSNFEVAGVKVAEQEIRNVFALHGKNQFLQIIYPDCDHDFPAEVRRAAYEFLDAALTHKPVGKAPAATPSAPQPAASR